MLRAGVCLRKGRLHTRLHPAYLKIDTDLSNGVIIVGRTGCGKTTLARHMLRGMLRLDGNVVAFIAGQTANEFMGEVSDAKLTTLGKPDTWRPDNPPSDSEAADTMSKYPRAVFHTTDVRPDKAVAKAANALLFMRNVPKETRKIVLVDDLYYSGMTEEVLADLAKFGRESNAIVVFVVQELGVSKQADEFTQSAGVRIILGGYDDIYNGIDHLSDTLRVSKHDVSGLKIHTALVVVGNKTSTVELDN